jgi:hypothetical protein
MLTDFSEKLNIKYEGIYVILTSKNGMPIFSKDSKINLTADDSNFISTLKYTGQGSIENQYIAKKNKYNFNPHMRIYTN